MLKFSENNKDLGMLRMGQPKSFTVQIVNPSATDLPIVSIKRGCGKCTQARMDVDVVKAYSSAPLNIVFTPDSTGINMKSVTVNGNMIFTFKAQVV